MRVIYFGSDYYSSIPLQIILRDKSFDVCAVVTNAFKSTLPFNYASVEEIARQNSIPCIKINDSVALAQSADNLTSLNADLGLVCSFGYLIPPSIFEIPRHGTLNIHPSLLPLYQGASPIQQTILDGVEQTGVSIIKINDKFDKGDIVYQKDALTYPNDSSLTLGKRLFELGAHGLLQIAPQYISQEIKGVAQSEHFSATHTRRFTTTDAEINWSDPSPEVLRGIRAFYPKPIAWTSLSNLVHHHLSDATIPASWNQKRVKIFQAHINHQHNIIPTTLQVEGKKVIDWHDFEQGYILAIRA